MAEGYEVYKVARKEGDLIYSCFAPTELQVDYKLGEKSFPKVGKLFCFEDLSSAIDFVKEMSFLKEVVIIRCETNSVDTIPQIEFIPDGIADIRAVEEYKNFWRDPIIWRESHSGSSIPEGTVFCNYVISIEFIDPKEVFPCM